MHLFAILLKITGFAFKYAIFSSNITFVSESKHEIHFLHTSMIY